MSAHFTADTATLTGRSLRHILRSPDTGSSSYVDYMLPGVLLITIASGIAYIAYRLFMDVHGGSSSASSRCPSRARARYGRTC